MFPPSGNLADQYFSRKLLRVVDPAISWGQLPPTGLPVRLTAKLQMVGCCAYKWATSDSITLSRISLITICLIGRNSAKAKSVWPFLSQCGTVKNPLDVKMR